MIKNRPMLWAKIYKGLWAIFQKTITNETKVKIRAVDPHSFYADPDPAVFLNADPDPGPAEPNLKKKIMKSFLKL